MKFLSKKESGIEWIGQIPSHWEIKRVKDVANVSTGQTPPREQIECFSDEKYNNYLWIKPENLNSFEEISETTEYITDYGLKFIKIYNKESLVLSGIGAGLGNVGISKYPFTTNQQNHILSKHKNYKYLFYFMFAAKEHIKSLSVGNILSILNATKLKNSLILNPTQKEQQKIANFLDIETSKIDKKIDILSQKLEKLEEYKQSVIFETVTKGLDKSVPMKDSGIEWIGNIPTHWEVKRVKDVLENMGGGNYGNDEGNDGLVIPCISISDFKNGNLYHNKNIKMNRVYQKNNILNKGTILIEKSGGGEKVPVGRIIYVKNDIEAYYTNFVQGIKIRKENSNYIFYCLQTIHKNKLHMNFVKQTTGLQNFEFNKFSNNFFIAIPKYNEQEKIVDFLNSKTSNIKQHQLIITKQIALLKEYKQSLIYEAVTGKTNIINTNDQLKNFINTIPYEKDTDLKDIIISKVIKELNIDYDEVINLILKLIDEKYLIKISCNQIGSMKVVNYGNGNSLIKDDKKYISIKVRIK